MTHSLEKQERGLHRQGLSSGFYEKWHGVQSVLTLPVHPTDPTDPCENNPCLHGGTCHTNGTVYGCSCDQGYAGENCEIGECPSSEHCPVPGSPGDTTEVI